MAHALRERLVRAQPTDIGLVRIEGARNEIEDAQGACDAHL